MLTPFADFCYKACNLFIGASRKSVQVFMLGGLFVFIGLEMININLKSNMFEVVHALKLNSNGVINKAASAAINKTAALVKTNAAREIRNVGYGMKVSAIKSQISITKATPSKLRALIVATGKPIGLINYGARQTANGVSVNVKNGRKMIKGAFIATMPNGHQGVFVRTDKLSQGTAAKPNRRGWKYNTIKELFGPSIPGAFNNPAVRDALIALVDERFPDLFAHEIEFRVLKR